MISILFYVPNVEQIKEGTMCCAQSNGSMKYACLYSPCTVCGCRKVYSLRWNTVKQKYEYLVIVNLLQDECEEDEVIYDRPNNSIHVFRLCYGDIAYDRNYSAIWAKWAEVDKPIFADDNIVDSCEVFRHDENDFYFIPNLKQFVNDLHTHNGLVEISLNYQFNFTKGTYTLESFKTSKPVRYLDIVNALDKFGMPKINIPADPIVTPIDTPIDTPIVLTDKEENIDKSKIYRINIREHLSKVIRKNTCETAVLLLLYFVVTVILSYLLIKSLREAIGI